MLHSKFIVLSKDRGCRVVRRSFREAFEATPCKLFTNGKDTTLLVLLKTAVKHLTSETYSSEEIIRHFTTTYEMFRGLPKAVWHTSFNPWTKVSWTLTELVQIYKDMHQRNSLVVPNPTKAAHVEDRQPHAGRSSYPWVEPSFFNGVCSMDAPCSLLGITIEFYENATGDESFVCRNQSAERFE